MKGDSTVEMYKAARDLGNALHDAVFCGLVRFADAEKILLSAIYSRAYIDGRPNGLRSEINVVDGGPRITTSTAKYLTDTMRDTQRNMKTFGFWTKVDEKASPSWVFEESNAKLVLRAKVMLAAMKNIEDESALRPLKGGRKTKRKAKRKS